MMELRMVTAMMIKRFTISFPPGQEQECEKFTGDQAGCFAISVYPLPILFQERKHS
ncbi:hypothetical protein K469DRAFT_128069 [Zopfia rhizophila CBS 207.26]|uniref:Uncharacterized protein n=1 Tax=Zopfia rhizophila CBS 207.26 TaxID=1314779 RepID=A0A6A6ETY9_9PEZI|nr:hypothetical protein K469DRAFT_128069 [Zopfia rhizophila CBS 207.26]